MNEESKKQTCAVPQPGTSPAAQPGRQPPQQPVKQPEQPKEDQPARREGVVSNPDPEPQH